MNRTSFVKTEHGHKAHTVALSRPIQQSPHLSNMPSF